MANKVNELKKEVVKYAKLLDEKGHANTTEGNISVMDHETGRLHITPSGLRKSFINEDLAAVLDENEQHVGKSESRCFDQQRLSLFSFCSAQKAFKPNTYDFICVESIWVACYTFLKGNGLPYRICKGPVQECLR